MYRYLDAAQLVKHSLGLMRGCPQAMLVYLYWEPRNWREFREFREHREEIADLPLLRAMCYGEFEITVRPREACEIPKPNVPRRVPLSI